MDETSGSLLVSSPVVLGVNPVLLNTLFVVFIQIKRVVKEHICHCKAYILLSVAGETIGGHLITRLDIHNQQPSMAHESQLDMSDGDATPNLLCTPQQVTRLCTGMQMKTVIVTVLHMPPLNSKASQT